MPTFFFHSGMAGAPTNTNAAGSTLEIIRSCLVTGFNLKSVVSASVTSEVMTLTYAAPHGYEDKVWLRLDGAAGGSITQRVTTAAGASTLTIPAPGFADGAVAGTLSTRVAPADWEEVFTGTLKAVFRSKVEGPGSTRFFYRVSDAVSGSSPAMLRGFESMSDVDAGIGPFPTVAQVSGEGLQVMRSQDATARSWVAAVDGRTMYLSLQQASPTSCYTLSFGDRQPFSSADLFCAFAASGTSGLISSGTQNSFAPRVAAGTGTAAIGYKIQPFGVQSGTGGRVYPSPIDGGLVFARPILSTDTADINGPIRGVFRGLMYMSSQPSSAQWMIFPSVTGVDGRVLVVRDVSTACVAFPIDEDWA